MIMMESISDRLRKLAAFIELDKTPSESVIGDQTMLSDTNDQDEKKKKIVAPIMTSEIKPTAPPQQRRPRKQPGHKNKWNADTKTDLMKEYMQNYRAEGKDKEVDGPKSTYKKKLN
jgi:hypothetical protein